MVLNLILFTLIFSPVQAMDPVPRDMPVLLSADLLKNSKSTDWRAVKQKDLLYLQLKSGLVLIELSDRFAPKHQLNIKQMAENKFWDGQRISRVQDNYVVQWGGPTKDKTKTRRVSPKLDGEYYTKDLDDDLITDLGDKDVYTSDVGFLNGFPVGHYSDKTWMLHCYGALGVGRANEFDSGNGSELYVVIGHSPRHLDLNITLVGKVRHGIELLSSLPRGKGQMGFYTKDQKGMEIISVRMGTQLPRKKQKFLKVLRTDTPLFKQFIGARKYRQEEWFHYRGGRVSVCNIPLPVKVN